MSHADRVTELLRAEQPLTWVNERADEQRLGQCIPHWQGQRPVVEQLQQWAQAGLRFVLLGVPEDIGPRANLGQGGADGGWAACLGRLLNLQWHPQLPSKQLALLGRLQVEDLQQQAASLDLSQAPQLQQLRQLVAQLDERLQALLTPIFAAGLTPIVIGGGHNNALPLIRAYQQAKGEAARVINLDPHADTRPCEGRHSGNPFGYALAEQALARYALVGMNPYKNSAATLAVFAQQHCRAFAGALSPQRLAQDTEQALQWLAAPKAPVGLELDLDAIAMMPSSAQTPWGVSLSQAQQYLAQVSTRQTVQWLHLAEGAPACHPNGSAAGNAIVGDSLAALLLTVLHHSAWAQPLRHDPQQNR
ncbi:arginase family protein [uncultured Ferrimonas sp.]|uniref:arginase family protein n=1 Tax=uncultured Ferrimonas sp. TaxID=432640 RepID=UPI00262225F9|nr:arginase family protein [uncultured Ferrimonas sp.]